jgi:hypothetical protein
MVATEAGLGRWRLRVASDFHYLAKLLPLTSFIRAAPCALLHGISEEAKASNVGTLSPLGRWKFDSSSWVAVLGEPRRSPSLEAANEARWSQSFAR